MNSVYRRFHKVLPNPCSDILYTIMFHEAVNLIHEKSLLHPFTWRMFHQVSMTCPNEWKVKNQWSQWGKTFNKLSLYISTEYVKQD